MDDSDFDADNFDELAVLCIPEDEDGVDDGGAELLRLRRCFALLVKGADDGCGFVAELLLVV